MSAADMRSTVLVLVAGLAGALLSAPAAAQVPPQRPSGGSDPPLPPMPAPQPVAGTPPAVYTPGPSQPVDVAPPPSGMATRPTQTAEPKADPAPPPAEGPTPPAGVAVDKPRRRAWGEGTTLLSRDGKVGVYIAPTFTIAGIHRSPGLMLGADFAVILGERFAIGAAGKALVTPLAAERSDGRTFNLRTQYAGITLGVALVRVKFFSLQLGALVGGGRACLNDERLDRCVNRAAMFVAEPELGVSFALTKVLRLVLSGGYRVAVAQAWSGPSNRLLSGLSGTLALRLGRF
jgi:hypothetical protein